MAQQKRIFNLLKPVAPPATIWDKIYDWILTRARVVILITELLIVIAFVGKVIEDTSAKNKEKEIETLQSELSFYSSDKEPLYRDIQKKDSVYASLWEKSSDYYDIAKEIYSYIENPGSQITIKFDKDRVSVLGYDDLTSVQQLETDMKGSKTFTSVVVDALSLEQKEILQQKGQYVLIAIISKYTRQPLQ